MSIRKSFAILVLAVVGASAAVAEVKQSALERGFAPDKLYQFADVDSIDLSSGTVALRIPIGPRYPAGGSLSYGLTLAWSSNLWDFEQRETSIPCGEPGQYCPVIYTQAFPNMVNNAGLGFMLSMGRLGTPGTDNNPLGQASLFTSPDGSQHQFFSKLHRSDDSNSTSDGLYTYSFTRDGSYLRMKFRTDIDTAREVQFGDGTIYTFGIWYPQVGHTDWRLTSIRDPFGNQVTVTYPTGTNNWVITDSQGRTSTVYFISKQQDGQSVLFVDHVDVAAFNGTTATYSFQYTDTVIARSCNDDDPETSATLGVSLLMAVVLPDNTSYAVANYVTSCTVGGTDSTGLPGRLTLPTGGTIDWAYQRWAYSATNSITGCIPNPPFEDCVHKIRLQWPGVATRTVTDPYGDSDGTWTYGTAVVWTPDPGLPGVPLERRTLVRGPVHDGTQSDDTVYYFRALPDPTLDEDADNDPNFDYWDYALPYTRRSSVTDPVTGKPGYLSVEYYLGAITSSLDAATVTGTLRRSVWVRHEHDQFDPALVNDIDEDYRSTNRQAAFTRTTYLDDSSRYADDKSFDFDGLGHYRSSVSDGNFDSGNVRKAFRNSNSDRGTYKVNGNQLDYSSQDWYTSLPGTESPANSFQMIAATSPWILATFDAEEDSEGSTLARREFCFEGSTGFLQRSRTLTTGATRGTNDALAVYARDSAGNRTREQYYGGDTQSVGTGTLCSLGLPSTDQYRIDHTYQYGSLRTSRYLDVNGTPLSYYLLDRDIDPNTGLPSASRDSAGIQTNFSYDGMARLTWEKPVSGQGAWVEYVYQAAAGPNAAKVDVYRRPNGSTTGILARESYGFDGLGRVSGEYRLLYNGAWNQRITTYNALGWKTSVSELQPSGTSGSAVRKTSYKNFDPFGRPTTITPPDGTTHDVTLAYSGVRQVTRTVKIATSTTTETSATTTEIYDRQGRLYQLIEPSGTSGANVTTTYSYDVGNRLKQASTTSSPVTQNRFLTYDNRGFLASEQLPEKGPSGNGFVYYYTYDPRGHVGRTVDGPNDLTYSYDRAERLTQVRETGGYQRTLKSFTFATANGGNDWANGKLRQAVANNYYDPNSPTNNFLSQETYTYGGVGGRISQRDTLAGIVGGNQGTFTQGFTWSDLGLPATVTYPQKSGVGPARTVTFDLTNGWLTRVHEGTTNYASSISYHANGMVNQVVHPNNTTDTFGKDPNDIARPASVKVQGLLGLTLWYTGTYTYDGSGNVWKMTNGSNIDTFFYDKVGRLLEGKILSVSKKQCSKYDAFGNIKGQATTSSSLTCTPSTWSVDSATNRMGSPVTYDAAGEQTSWNSGAYVYWWYPTGEMRQFDGSNRATVYGYTADSERVATYDSLLGTITYPLRGLDNKVLRVYRESGGVWTWLQDYVYRDGAHLATIDSSGTRYLHLDHLGTIRLITNSSGGQVALHTYLPFGQEATSTSQDSEAMKFTGHERDLRDPGNTTDDLDAMHARYYNPNLGRFLIVDPGRNVDPKTPQAWNMYAYARDNPVSYFDPDGKMALLPAAAVGGLVGGLVNTAVRYVISQNQGKAFSWSDARKAFAVGFVAGGVAAGTAGLASSSAIALLSLPTETAFVGLGSSAVGASLGGAIQGAGNAYLVEGRRDPEQIKAAATTGFMWGAFTSPLSFGLSELAGSSAAAAGFGDRTVFAAAQGAKAVGAEASAVLDLYNSLWQEIQKTPGYQPNPDPSMQGVFIQQSQPLINPGP